MSGAANAALMHRPNLVDMLEIALESHSNLLRVAMPGRVLKYNNQTHKAEVQPLIKYQKEGGSPRDLAPIAGVPIVHPRSQAGAVYLPIAPGDLVTLLCSDRDLSRWRAGNGQTAMPLIMRAHDLADCWAIPGGYPDGIPPNPRFPDALEIYLSPGTKFAVSNGTTELMDKIDVLLDKLDDWIAQDQLHTHVTVTSLGTPTPPDAATLTIYAAAQTAIDGVRSALDELKA